MIDGEIRRLAPTLRELYCSLNPELTVLPEALLQLHHLTVLDVSRCSLDALPDELGGALPELQRLNCSHNRLKRFLWTCSGLKNLRELDLSHNPIEYFSAEAMSILRRVCTQQNVSVELVPMQKLFVTPLPNLLSRTSALSPRDLDEMLPFAVADRFGCCVCGQVPAQGKLRAFVLFDEFDVSFRPQRPKFADETQLAEEAVGDTQAALVQVPVLFAVCRSDAECHKTLHSRLVFSRRIEAHGSAD